MRLARHLIALSAIAAIVQPARSAPVDDWWYEATPYLHAAGMKGTLGARGVTADTDISFSDAVSKLDMAFQGTLQAHKGPLTLGLDTEYLRLSDDGVRSVTGPAGRGTVLGKLEATSTLATLQATVGYRVLDEQTKVELVGGLRATKINADLDLKGMLTVGDAEFGRSRSVDRSKEWVDVLVGARVFHPISDNVNFLAYVDVGGGGSDLTWQALAGVNWEFKPGYTMKLGYRQLSWDYSNGGFVWDMKLHGPYAGLGIRF